VVRLSSCLPFTITAACPEYLTLCLVYASSTPAWNSTSSFAKEMSLIPSFDLPNVPNPWHITQPQTWVEASRPATWHIVSHPTSARLVSLYAPYNRFTCASPLLHASWSYFFGELSLRVEDVPWMRVMRVCLADCLHRTHQGTESCLTRQNEVGYITSMQRSHVRAHIQGCSRRE
jgi:hypothetical protein